MTAKRGRAEEHRPLLIVGGALALGGLVLALSATRTAQSVPRDQLGLLAFDERDVEAAARMLASENSTGPLSLHVEQLFTQVRQAIKRGVRLYDQITAGSDFGGQGERSATGRLRPVATGEPATSALLDRARAILSGQFTSQLSGAMRFFEPAQSDAAFAIAEEARRKMALGIPLNRREFKLLKYKKNAATVRASWSAHSQLIGTISDVEFWS